LFTVNQLEQMSQIDVKDTDREKLIDIQTININPLHTATGRMESYFEQIKNPYCFLCDDTIVKIRFEPKGKDLAQSLKNYFVNIKKVDSNQ